jgi:hypothetical protein
MLAKPGRGDHRAVAAPENDVCQLQAGSLDCTPDCRVMSARKQRLLLLVDRAVWVSMPFCLRIRARARDAFPLIPPQGISIDALSMGPGKEGSAP